MKNISLHTCPNRRSFQPIQEYGHVGFDEVLRGWEHAAKFLENDGRQRAGKTGDFTLSIKSHQHLQNPKPACSLHLTISYLSQTKKRIQVSGNEEGSLPRRRWFLCCK